MSSGGIGEAGRWRGSWNAARLGPVIITDRGVASHDLLSNEEFFRRLCALVHRLVLVPRYTADSARSGARLLNPWMSGPTSPTNG